MINNRREETVNVKRVYILLYIYTDQKMCSVNANTVFNSYYSLLPILQSYHVFLPLYRKAERELAT